MYVVLPWSDCGLSVCARSKSMKAIGVVVNDRASFVRPMIFMPLAEDLAVVAHRELRRSA